VLLQLLWIVPLVLLISFLASPRFRGDIAQTRVRRILAAGLQKNSYTVFNDVTLPTGGGTARIDHLVVSRFGVFVITSRYVRGWVSGGEFQERWKQEHYRHVSRFDNPVHENVLQAQAVEKFLKLRSSKLHRIVVLVGNKGIKNSMPLNVVSAERLIPFMRKKAIQVLDADEADSLLQKIQKGRIESRMATGLSKLGLLKIILWVTLFAGAFYAFREDIQKLQEQYAEQREQAATPDAFHPDGSRKSEQELWEDSLVCAWSEDTGRCACYQPDGDRVEITTQKCKSLAERGSVLKQ